jgi:PTS system beta-glucosides-specific IIC component
VYVELEKFGVKKVSYNFTGRSKQIMKFEEQSKKIIQCVGGKENINSVIHCATRLRFDLKDSSKADTAALEEMPEILKVMNSGGQYQVVIGSHVPTYYANISRLAGLSEAGKYVRKKFSVNYIFEVISGGFSPLIPIMAGAGMVMALLTVLLELKVLTWEDPTFLVLYSAYRSVFYFMPIFLGITLSKKLEANMYVGGAIAASLLVPEFMGLIGVEGTRFLGIKLIAADYSASLFPILIAVIVYALLERLLKKIILRDVQLFAVPMICLLVMVPLTALLFGPFGTVLGGAVSNGLMWLLNKSGLIAGIVIGGGMPFLVILGLHWGLAPIELNNLEVLGGDPIEGIAVAAVFAQIGIAIGMYLKAKKHSNVRKFAGPTALTGLLAGVTEPILYSFVLRYRRLIPILIVSGAAGGIICGIAGVTMDAYVFHNVFSAISCYTPKMPYFIGIAVSLLLGLALTYFFGVKKDEMADLRPEKENGSQEAGNKETSKAVLSPLSGTVIPLEKTGDETFASGVLGPGIAILPDSDTIYAPVNGIVAEVFDSKHAIGIESENGFQLLIHAGINTVALGGEHFECFVKEGSRIKTGDKLLTFDTRAVTKKGYSTLTTIIVTEGGKAGLDMLVKESEKVLSMVPIFKVKT